MSDKSKISITFINIIFLTGLHWTQQRQQVLLQDRCFPLHYNRSQSVLSLSITNLQESIDQQRMYTKVRHQWPNTKGSWRGWSRWSIHQFRWGTFLVASMIYFLIPSHWLNDRWDENCRRLSARSKLDHCCGFFGSHTKRFGKTDLLQLYGS